MIKTCSVCGQDKEHKSWKSTTCNDCLDAGLKWCSVCHTTKPLSEFHTCRGKPLGMCKTCECDRSRRSHLDNDYYSRPEVQDKRREASRTSKQIAMSNPTTRRAVYDRHNELKRLHYANDADFRQITKEQSRLYRACKQDAGHFTAHEWSDALAYFNNSCAYCGSPEHLAQDHVVALSRGGSNTASNIVLCCRSCNSSKRARGVSEWYKAQSFYSQSRLDSILQYLNGKLDAEVARTSGD